MIAVMGVLISKFLIKVSDGCGDDNVFTEGVMAMAMMVVTRLLLMKVVLVMMTWCRDEDGSRHDSGDGVVSVVVLMVIMRAVVRRVVMQ